MTKLWFRLEALDSMPQEAPSKSYVSHLEPLSDVCFFIFSDWYGTHLLKATWTALDCPPSLGEKLLPSLSISQPFLSHSELALFIVLLGTGVSKACNLRRWELGALSLGQILKSQLPDPGWVGVCFSCSEVGPTNLNHAWKLSPCWPSFPKAGMETCHLIPVQDLASP